MSTRDNRYRRWRTVAFIGADGAGKTSVARRVQARLGPSTQFMYMNVNFYSLDAVLPTTRLWVWLKLRRGESDPARAHESAAGAAAVQRPIRGRLVRGVLSLAVQLSEQVARHAIVAYHLSRGRSVVLDRYFAAEYWYSDESSVGARRSFTRRILRALSRHVFPKPDVVICLDAPGSFLYQRKTEYSPEILEKLRLRYLSSAPMFRRFFVIDAMQPIDVVVQEVTDLLNEAGRRPRGDRPGSQSE